MSQTCWGIDLGGTKIEGVVLPAGDSVDPLCRKRVPTERDRGYDHVRHRIVELVDELAAEIGERPTAIGVGTPGALDPDTQTLKNSNTTCLIGKPLQQHLNSDLGCRVELANDANCFALAEARLGAAKGVQSVFGVILGTGVGGGLVFDGQVVHGAQGIGGEWGHNVLDPEGPECYCGLRGCVETFLAGPKLEEFYEERSSNRRPLAEIAERAAGGTDPTASDTINRLVESFGRALASVVNVVDPHVVVLGGGVSNVAVLYERGAAELERWVFNDRLLTQLRRNELGDSAGVFGAAMLVA